MQGSYWRSGLLASLAWCLLMMSLSTLVSCGGPAGPTTIPVRGKITLGGGPWPQKGTIYFTPIKPAEGMPHQVGIAEFEPDGSFRVSSYRPNDGLVPGEYSVNIECWEIAPSPEDPNASRSYLPKDYHALLQSQLPIVIPLDARGTVQVTLDIPKR